MKWLMPAAMLLAAMPCLAQNQAVPASSPAVEEKSVEIYEAFLECIAKCDENTPCRTVKLLCSCVQPRVTFT